MDDSLLIARETITEHHLTLIRDHPNLLHLGLKDVNFRSSKGVSFQDLCDEVTAKQSGNSPTLQSLTIFGEHQYTSLHNLRSISQMVKRIPTLSSLSLLSPLETRRVDHPLGIYDPKEDPIVQLISENIPHLTTYAETYNLVSSDHTLHLIQALRNNTCLLTFKLAFPGDCFPVAHLKEMSRTLDHNLTLEKFVTTYGGMSETYLHIVSEIDEKLRNRKK